MAFVMERKQKGLQANAVVYTSNEMGLVPASQKL